MKQSMIRLFAAVAITTLIAVSPAIAQHHRPYNHQQPNSTQLTPQNYNPYGAPHQPQQPTTIVIPANPPGTWSESMVFGPNGQITIIQQQGTDTFVTTY